MNDTGAILYEPPAFGTRGEATLRGWDIEYRCGSRELKVQSDTRENALRHACDRMVRGDTVDRITGPGEVIERPEPSRLLRPVPKAAIMRLAQTISDDLYQAVFYYEVFAPSGLDSALIDRVNSRQIHPGFNVVSEALQLSVIVTLCRIWDKTRGTARITEVANRLRKNPGLVTDQAELARWQADVDKTEKSDQLMALHGFRNVGLAHRSDPNAPDPRSKGDVRRVLHGDERIVLEATIPIVKRLNSLIGASYCIEFDQARYDWKRHGAEFWNSIKRGISARLIAGYSPTKGKFRDAASSP